MSDFELYRDYPFGDVLAAFGLQPDAVGQSDTLALHDRLLIFYDPGEMDKDWRFTDSDRFLWVVRWQAFEAPQAETKPPGMWVSNIEFGSYPPREAPPTIRLLINQSAKREQKDKAVPVLFFMRSGNQPTFQYTGDLYLDSAYQHFHRIIDGQPLQTVKVDPPESERIFEIVPRLPEALWLELTNRRWTLQSGGHPIHFNDDAGAIEHLKLLFTQPRGWGCLTRYPRDGLFFTFAKGEATFIYNPIASEYPNFYLPGTVYAVNPSYQGDPEARFESAEFVFGYDILENWPSAAMFSEGEAFRLIEAYVREGQLPGGWEWRQLRESRERPDAIDLPF